MIIRKARMSDCKECHEMSNMPELLSPNGKAPNIGWFEAHVRNNQIMFLAEENKKIIGYVAGEELIEHGMILHLIAVMPEYRNKGIGKRLVTAFENECKKRKVRWIMLYAYDTKNTVQFFKKNNYEKGSRTIEFVKYLGEPVVDNTTHH